MARRYHRGIGVPINYKIALDWYLKPAPSYLPAQTVVTGIYLRSPEYNSGPLNLEAMAELASLPIVASVSTYAPRTAPMRDHDLMASMEALLVEPFATKLRAENEGANLRVAGSSVLVPLAGGAGQGAAMPVQIGASPISGAVGLVPTEVKSGAYDDRYTP